jgi:hypothetical protein
VRLTGPKMCGMKRELLLFIFCLAALATLASAVIDRSFAQAPAGSVAAQAGVALVKLTPPVYPRIARTVSISGEVDLMLGIRRDGSVESANVVSGPPLLQQAALDSAQGSQFQCTGCSEPVTPYSLAYTFRLIDVGCCATTEERAKIVHDYGQLPHVIQSQNQITLIEDSGCFCESFGLRKVRAAKCLYLWRCGYP